MYGARAVQKEIVRSRGGSQAQVYFVWLPMLASDNQSQAEAMVRQLGAGPARDFYDPHRRIGIAFVKDHFRAYMHEALSKMPAEHPFHQRLAQALSQPADEAPLWDAVLFFAPGVEWKGTAPRPDWWAKQVGFSGENPGHATGRFWRSETENGPVESDWFDEARHGVKLMLERAHLHGQTTTE